MSIPDLNPPAAEAAASCPPLRRSAGGGRAIAAAEEDSDEDLLTVPDVESAEQSEFKVAGGGAAAPATASAASSVQQNGGGGRDGKFRRTRSTADREHRRIRRLLRNRVSAQLARERKKLYVDELESKVKDFEVKNSSLEERISTLINENNMLRKVLMNTRPKVDEEGSSSQNDQSGTS